jgi:Terminase large subunit, T4likevirus-type, N-terminal
MIELRGPQWDVFCCDKRFRALVAGRRFGKTYLALVELCQAAWEPGRLAWYVAPTYKQAKRVAWRPLKELTRAYWASLPNETDLRIDLMSGGTICLRGADNYDSLRGDGLDFLVLDEYASVAKEAWTEVLRPALADKQGRALFIGTPRGFNHFHDLVERAATLTDWKAFHFTTAEGGNVSLEELESAAKEMDQRTYNQEFNATFENLGVGRAYYCFDRGNNVRTLGFSSQVALSWSLDFNIDPLCSVLAQVQNGVVCVLEEMILPDSNTLAACEELLRRTAKWNFSYLIQIEVYGDASEPRQTSASRTDWQIVKEFFGRYRDRFQSTFHVPSSNPLVKDRVNCVNARLRNQAGQNRLFVDQNCKHLIKDLEQVSWRSDPYGNALAVLDKSDRARTHVSDALGYLITRVFPMRAQMGEKPGPALL